MCVCVYIYIYVSIYIYNTSGKLFKKWVKSTSCYQKKKWGTLAASGGGCRMRVGLAGRDFSRGALWYLLKFEPWGLLPINNKHTVRRKIHARSLWEAIRSRWSGWGLERSGLGVRPPGMAWCGLSGQVPQHDAAAAPQGWWSGAHVRRHLPGELCPCALLAGLSPGEPMAAGVGPSVWSQEGTCILPTPSFLPGLQMTQQTYGWHNLLRVCGWMGWEHSSPKKLQPHSTVSKTNSFLYPMTIFSYIQKLCDVFLTPGDNASLVPL